jgi:hypothetical protein
MDPSKPIDKQLRMQASIDGELSVDEAIALEAELSGDERAEFEREREFEKALAGELNSGPDCPDAAWEELKTQINSNADSNMPWVIRFAPLAAAAAIALLVFVNRGPAGGEILISETFDVQEFSGSAEVPGDLEKIRSSLTANNFHVKLRGPDPAAHHQVTLLGLRYGKSSDGHKVAELMFSCCGKPIKAYLFDKGHGVTVRESDLDSNWYKGSRAIDRYRVTVVGPHGVTDVMDLFS